MQIKDIAIRNLNFENMSIWPKKIKYSLFALICLLFFLLGYWIDLRVEILQLQKKNYQEQCLIKEIENKYPSTHQIFDYQKQINILRQQFTNMIQQFPRKSEIPKLLNDITKAGIHNHLIFNLFKLLPEKQKGFYTELPIQIKVMGHYHQLGKFISKIAQLNRIFTVEDYCIENTVNPEIILLENKNDEGSEKLILSITAKTFHYRKE